ncbi:hypothetical protein BDP55DRAFT_761980 [Colletotrichum godetiae]|uniref:Uncharacterized protein n=1 Tax=Colletotrichum godetiae TaxID=1209918 RepID=A0AAJ0A699_9PEZI|nr:uncharacterized protein BDP55DRAFT_761980 [Colletotrichum godetiae]KAK1657245.1 hypothetical protein BDP55DRAFT_761980 [Colletotrichum godetiae]
MGITFPLNELTQYSNIMEDSASVNCGETNVSSSASEAQQNDTADSLIGDYSANGIQQFLLDIIIIIPSICFIIYGLIALRHNDQPIDKDPVPALRVTATYSPTVFPIVYAAITANLLKAAAGWKMERGVTVLSLEYLLSCRTVFSAVTTPLSLRSLWFMSPLGGQAALRIIDVVSSQASESYPFECLEFMSIFPHSGPQSSAGNSILPSIQGAFISALSSPKDIKAGPRDAFGNVKIPMLEYYRQTSTTKPDAGGWYNVNSNDEDNVWSAIIGIPIATQGGFSQGQNYSFTMTTAYMSADCSVQRGELMTYGMWYEYQSQILKSQVYGAGGTLIIKSDGLHNQLSKDPRHLILTAYYPTNETNTNATCTLVTTHAEVDVACHGPLCGARRIRRIEKPANMTVTTVLDGVTAEGYHKIAPVGVFDFFMKTLMRVTLTIWQGERDTLYKPFPSPLETYFTYPDAPFSAPGIGSWNGTDIYQVGDEVVSQRFSQLLNTFWLASVASRNITGNFNFRAQTLNPGIESTLIQNITGTRTPDELVMRVNEIWISILFITSAIMLASGIAASIFSCLRRGPDVLDRATFFLRDNPHVKVAQQSSLEDGTSQVKRVKGVRVCIVDVTPLEETGHVAFGTVGEAMPLRWQEKERRYS